MDWIFLTGRILFTLTFIDSGIKNHLLGRKRGIAYARQYKAPFPEITVPASGLAIVVGSAMIVLGVWGDAGALLIAAFLATITPVMHGFWRETDPMQKQLQWINLTKNLALLGGAVVLFYLWNQLQSDAGLSLTSPLFGRL